MSEEKQVPRGLSIMIVTFISLIISFFVAGVSYFYIFPEIEKQYFFVKTPDVRRLPLNEAINRILLRGLKYTILEESESMEFPAKTIMFQFPLPNVSIRKGSEVGLIVSKGMPMSYVPKIKGKTIEEAKKILSDSGLVLGEVKKIETDQKSEDNIVLEVSPNEGFTVLKGSRISISIGEFVQKKKEVNVIVPSVVGKTLLEAKKIIESKGLKLGKITKTTNENFDFDIILYQKPSAGGKVVSGSKIDITINSEEE